MALIKHHFYVKMLIAISISIAVFCITSNLVIATLFGEQLVKKTRTINREYASVVYSYLSEMDENLELLGLLAENNSNIRWAMSQKSLSMTSAKKYALAAQESLDAYLNASQLNDFVEVMAVVNDSGMLVSASAGKRLAAEQIYASPLFEEEIQRNRSVIQITPSASDSEQMVLAYLYPLNAALDSFIYIELDPEIIQGYLDVYQDSADLMVRSMGRYEATWFSSEGFKQRYENGEINEKGYLMDTMDFAPDRLSVQVFTSREIYSTDNAYLISMLFVVCLTVICVGISVSRLLSRRISQPLNRLCSHIVRLTDEDNLTVNPEIERGEDEVAEIGKVFNRLVRHINDLILRQKEMYEQKQRLEINALQAQINPHFLYNTLDSIRWMAVIQKSTSIANTVMSLENLLRNMAKGAGDKISLGEELSFVQDYVNLQQVRYVEIFDYICQVPKECMDCRIVKMTIQPIVENVILHGIEPTGTYGEIRIGARKEGEDLCIYVEDNGAGMDEEELDGVLKDRGKKNKNSMSGIGIVNVHERLKMIYGERYGLFYESEKGIGTRVTVRIPEERGEDRLCDLRYSQKRGGCSGADTENAAGYCAGGYQYACNGWNHAAFQSQPGIPPYCVYYAYESGRI